MAEFVKPEGQKACDAVIYSGRILETVICPIRDGENKPVPGGPTAEMEEIFRQIDEVLAGVGADKTNIVSVRLFLQDVNRDIAEVNVAYRAYFGDHYPMRMAVGADLQVGMLIEASITAELPQ